MGRGSVTTEQAAEQMPMPVRLRTQKGQVGGAAGSTQAFLRTVRTSLKPAQNGSDGARERKTEREASGFGPTALRPLSREIPSSSSSPSFYRPRRESFGH